MSFFTQITDALNLCSGEGDVVRKVRTTADPPMAPEDALELLKEGNSRFVAGRPLGSKTQNVQRHQLVDEGQAPHTAIIGCADSRAPLETIFDAMPGDIFVLRNAGNTCTHAEGSMIGSLEFCTGKLGSRLILVLGHTKCGAIYGATKTFLDAQQAQEQPKKAGSALEGLLKDLGTVAQQAAEEKGPGASSDEVAAHAVKVNVFHSMNFLLKFSDSIREAVKSGQVQLQGGIYHLETGKVEFLGKSPAQRELLDSTTSIPPSMTAMVKESRGLHGVRTAADERVPSDAALKMLKAGNERFATGAVTAGTTSSEMRKALVKYNQAPHSAIIGCADSRVPVDTVFDATPGELFVLRNAGNNCTHAEGSMVGSLEFCTGKLGSRLILVLGHTQCGAIAGATATHQAGGEVKAPACALEGLLQGLANVAKEASEDLGPGVSQEKLVSHAVKVNVFNSMNFLLQFSEPLRELVRKGELDIQGGIYHLETGRVEFLGRSPRQDELLSSKVTLPPSMAIGAFRTTEDGILEPKVALKMLKDGNQRFVSGVPVLGKVDRHVREALATKGQAPHTAVVGCADSRVPLETVFDALPGDLFCLRNAGNTCTHAEGSILGSLEFCTGALNTRLIFVLGHTACEALKGATAAYLSQGEKKANHALDVLLNELGTVVSERIQPAMARKRSSSLPSLRRPLIEPQQVAGDEVGQQVEKCSTCVTTHYSICTPEGSRRSSKVHTELSEQPDEEIGLNGIDRGGNCTIVEESPAKNDGPSSRRKRRTIRQSLEGCWDCGCSWSSRCCKLKGHHLHCFQLCCARLTCSWCLKMLLLVVIVNYIFLSGPLSQPLWIPISTKAACEENDDGSGPASVKRVGHKANVTGGLHACEALCNGFSRCQAVDWYNDTRWCNLYATPCLRPTASWDGASSYQKAVVCRLFNGTSGVLIGGRCHVGIHVPSMSSVVEQELPAMLRSPKSWSFTLLVALIYTYVMSAWFRKKFDPVVKRIQEPTVAAVRWTLGAVWRKAAMLLILLALWAAATVHYWELPPVSAVRKLEKGERPPLPYMEWIWMGVSMLLFLLVICKGFRACILSAIVTLGTCIMSAFASLCTFATSLCVETGLMAEAAAIGGVGAAAATVEGAAGAAATAEAGVAVESAAAADAALGAKGAAAADVAAGGAAAGEAATAAEAAATAEAVAAADAVAVAEGVGILALCAIQ